MDKVKRHMDTIQDTPEETFGAQNRHTWSQKMPVRLHDPKPSLVSKPRGRPFSRQSDWRTVAMVSAGIVAGVVLGAGVALLMAPQSGEHTRLAIGRELRKRRPWRRTPWERLGEEFREAARFGRSRLRLREGQRSL